MTRYTFLLAFMPILGLIITVPALGQEPTLLLQQPAQSQNHIAFVYGGDIWLANRDGGQPRRLTSHPARESNPHFSPDGQWLAFSANYESNTDVYLIAVAGGPPKRLTWHPGPDTVNGWSPDGGKILFSSPREIAHSRSSQLWHISPDGGYPEKIMEAVAWEGTWSPDGDRIAYRPYWAAHGGGSGWRLHRGGTTPPIWIIDADGQNVEKIPHPRANETNPMWLGNTVYFLSDRDDVAVNLFAYNTTNGSVTQLTRETEWDIRSADAFGGNIVYEVGGRLKRYSLASGESEEIVVRINPDAPQLRPTWKSTRDAIELIVISPTGKRALVTARGEVFTLPVKDGSTRNLTASDDIREYTALWSPVGDKIAYVSDDNGNQELVVVDQSGREDVERYPLGDPAYYSLLSWGAKGEKIIYQDNHLNLFVIELGSGDRELIDTDAMRSFRAVSVSPDGRWLAYTHTLPNYFQQIVLYNFATNEKSQLTEGFSWASQPSFSRDGQYLYFTASTNAGPLQFGLDMTTQEKPFRSGLYVAVLAEDGKSPLLPKTGDESPEEKTEDDEETEEAIEVNIDLDGLSRRLVALPVAERFYTDLYVDHEGSLYFLERQQPGITNEPPEGEERAVNHLQKFDFEEREVSSIQDGIINYTMSQDGKTLLIQGKNNDLSTAEVGGKIEPEPLAMAGMKAYIDPRNEWRQIFNDVWRMEKEFFYAENLHGIDWEAVRAKYEPLLEHVITRRDLNRLLVEMIAELQVGHNRVGGGDMHRDSRVDIGLLGANIRVDNNRYRIDKIFTGESWNPFLQAPLAVPGVDVNPGDYILAINGIEVDAGTNIYALLAETVGEQVTLTVNDSLTLNGSREVVIKPVRSEFSLREWDWIEANRRYVDEQTDGQVGYIYLPNTGDEGFTYFNRMFFPQINKQALIIDERRNGGGQAANYITDVLSRQYLAGWKDRDGVVMSTPAGANYGPKIMLINQDAGSGGDFLPYSFRHLGLGTLVGTRTWGGLIGISANPGLIDGGGLVVPFFRFFTTDGQWAIENEGVAPDIEVELEPDAVNRGVDTQLDRAIVEALQQLENYEPVKMEQAPPLPTQPGQ